MLVEQLASHTPLFDYSPEIRRIIYTTNAIQSVNVSLRTVTKNRGSFSSDDALLELFYVALANTAKKWTMPLRDWKTALTRFTIQLEERPVKTLRRLHKIQDTLETYPCTNRNLIRC